MRTAATHVISACGKTVSVSAWRKGPCRRCGGAQRLCIELVKQWVAFKRLGEQTVDVCKTRSFLNIRSLERSDFCCSVV